MGGPLDSVVHEPYLTGASWCSLFSAPTSSFVDASALPTDRPPRVVEWSAWLKVIANFISLICWGFLILCHHHEVQMLG